MPIQRVETRLQVAYFRNDPRSYPEAEPGTGGAQAASPMPAPYQTGEAASHPLYGEFHR